MNKIHVLDEKTAAKIAAGEVIEHPAGVLKELLENAIDAGATAISVTVEGSGKTLIRVNDNGCGMSEQDLAASVLRHATSKITDFEDLEQLQTFGFRGEALYSVAAVSRMTLTSCTGASAGSRLEVHAGKVVSQSPAPAIRGTTVEIRDLFFNTPARLKFLKSDAYERARLLKVIEESALANVRTSYKVVINGREVYNLPAQTGEFDATVRARAREIIGPEVADTLLCAQRETPRMALFVTPADRLVSVRDMQYMFVNRRPVEAKILQQAVYKAYQNVRGKDKHPAFIIYLTLPPSEFDVNIHPQKRDIRFTDEHGMFAVLMNEVARTVFSHTAPVQVAADMALPEQARPAAEVLFTAPSVKDNHSFAPAPVIKETKPIAGLRETPITSFQPRLSVPPADAPSTEKPVSASPLPTEKKTDTPEWFVGPYRYLGQLQRSYLLFENPQGLILIDQHAAQERVLFEKYLEAFDAREVAVQELLFPLHVDLVPSNAQALLSWAPWLKTAGFEIEPFSPRTVLVRTRPYVIRFHESDLKDFIVSLAQVVGDPAKSTETLKRKMVAMLACKKAVKAHDALTAAEAEALVEQMRACKDGMHCPHGRPCVALLSMKDADKLFGR